MTGSLGCVWQWGREVSVSAGLSESLVFKSEGRTSFARREEEKIFFFRQREEQKQRSLLRRAACSLLRRMLRSQH